MNIHLEAIHLVDPEALKEAVMLSFQFKYFDCLRTIINSPRQESHKLGTSPSDQIFALSG
ncbi:unnamed protein product [Periconia digitata]|uniref:Uncharacterized protein n=1 Tax=Periconia digitata TaxID=1303443 RepID=A0A9W4XSG5_9PLEO|nr:unnamed protein product [Periconia digitata]